MVVSTTILFILGLASIVVGGLALGGIHDYGVTDALKVPEIPIGLIVAGVIVLLLSVLGKVGTFKESQIFLFIFFGILLLITITELGLGIAAYTLADEPTMTKEVEKYWPKFSNTVHGLIQNNFECCGLHGVPDTHTACPPKGLNQGCLIPFSKWLTAKIETLDIIAVVSAVVQVMILTFSILLAKAVSKRKGSDTVPLLSSKRLIHV
jgi:hypothetical protein